jgi:hypothetical protein
MILDLYPHFNPLPARERERVRVKRFERAVLSLIENPKL